MTAQALYKSCGKSHGKEHLKRKALRRPRKTDIEGVDVMCWDRLFQVRAAATGKARSRRTFSDSEEADRRRLTFTHKMYDYLHRSEDLPSSCHYVGLHSNSVGMRNKVMKIYRKKNHKTGSDLITWLSMMLPWTVMICNNNNNNNMMKQLLLNYYKTTTTTTTSKLIHAESDTLSQLII